VIPVKKLDGSEMYINEDLVERVEETGVDQSVVYMRDGGHLVIADQATEIVAKVRSEKAALLKAAQGAEVSLPSPAPITGLTRSGRLSGR
jgi:uncharacterized protein YlzI (FlbEa/FlbD family)